MTTEREMSLRRGSVKNISDAMKRDYFPGSSTKLGRTLLLVGAGCSRSAGVPLASEIAQTLSVDLANRYTGGLRFEDATASLEYLIQEGHLNPGHLAIENGEKRCFDWNIVYDEIFTSHYRTPKEVRRVFSDIFSKSDGTINWAHISIGELVRIGYVSTVLTTNFDQLVLEGIARTGRLPVVADGLESLYRITGDPDYPQLIQIHGSRHTYYLRNSMRDVELLAEENSARHAIDELFREAGVFIAIGYGGRERGLMQLIIDAGKRFPDTQIFWVCHSKDLGSISDMAKELLHTSNFSAVVPGQDADDFFLELLTALGCSPPKIIVDPMYSMRELKENLVFSANEKIRTLIDEHQVAVVNIQNASIELLNAAPIGLHSDTHDPETASAALGGSVTSAILKEGAFAEEPSIKTILLVEDDISMRSFLVRALEAREFHVLEASNGIEALTQFKQNQGCVDIVCTDVVMPTMGGATLFSEVRKIDVNVPFLFFSGYASEILKKNISEHEQLFFISKPFSIKQFIASMREALGENSTDAE